MGVRYTGGHVHMVGGVRSSQDAGCDHVRGTGGGGDTRRGSRTLKVMPHRPPENIYVFHVRVTGTKVNLIDSSVMCKYRLFHYSRPF